MKKIVVAVVAMLAIGTSSFAQGFGWGVKAGLNVSGMNNTGLDSKTGLTAGVFVDYRFNDWIGMSADLLFSREGAMLKSGGDKYIAKTNYLNLPILAKFYVLDQLAFNIGIQPGVLLSGSYYILTLCQNSSKVAILKLLLTFIKTYLRQTRRQVTNKTMGGGDRPFSCLHPTLERNNR